jgi:hypothetical protein
MILILIHTLGALALPQVFLIRGILDEASGSITVQTAVEGV